MPVAYAINGIKAGWYQSRFEIRANLYFVRGTLTFWKIVAVLVEAWSKQEQRIPERKEKEKFLSTSSEGKRTWRQNKG